MASSQIALAGDPPTPSAWRLSGFGTLGVTRTNATAGATLARDPSSPTASPTSAAFDSRLGLQANWTLHPTLEAVAQLVLKPRPEGAKPSESIEWAFVSWRPNDQWQLRLGRVSPDIFLHSDVRSVGFAYPWVRPNIDYYGVIPYNSADGVDLTWGARHDDGATTRLKAMLGGSHITLRANDPSQPSAMLTSKDIAGLTFTHDRGDWLLRATAVDSRLTVDLPALQPLLGGLQQLAAMQLPGVADEARALARALDNSGRVRYYSLGAQWDSGPWLVHLEANRFAARQGLADGSGGYLSVAHRFGVWQPFVMASYRNASRSPMQSPTTWAATLTPLVGAAAAQQAAMLGSVAAPAANAARYEQRTLTAGVRWNFHPRAAWKFQVDRVNVSPNGGGIWTGMPATGGGANMISTTLDTVF